MSEHLRIADDLRSAITRLARRLRRLRDNHGISPAKLIILGHLQREGGGLTAIDLARLENLQPQSLTRIIAELEERALISRQPGQTDRRQILIDITQEGRALLARDAQLQTRFLAQAIETNLTGTEQALLHLAIGLLDRLSTESQPNP